MAGHICGGNGRMLRQFNGKREITKMPCKYPAVRQECGSYFINLTPGNLYLYPKYRMDSLWLGIEDISGGGVWEGRTDNRIAVKYINKWISELFNKKDGNLLTDDVLVFGRNNQETWVKAKNGDFKVTFTPWDPENDNFELSAWSFECKRS